MGVLGVLVVFTTASMPDVDLRLPVVSHRGITHTVWAAVAVGGVVAGPVYYFQGTIAATVPELGGYTPLSFALFVGGFLAFSVIGHLVGDMLTPMGIRPFEPLSAASFSLNLWPADSIANKALFGLGVAVVAGTTYALAGL